MCRLPIEFHTKSTWTAQQQSRNRLSVRRNAAKCNWPAGLVETARSGMAWLVGICREKYTDRESAAMACNHFVRRANDAALPRRVCTKKGRSVHRGLRIGSVFIRQNTPYQGDLQIGLGFGRETPTIRENSFHLARAECRACSKSANKVVRWYKTRACAYQ